MRKGTEAGPATAARADEERAGYVIPCGSSRYRDPRPRGGCGAGRLATAFAAQAGTWIRVSADPQNMTLSRVFADGDVLVEPSDEELAAKLGIAVRAERACYDLIIIVGGAAGLAAAMYAAREGIGAVVIDSGGLGGNAGVTGRIDNYPGFPDGIGGRELMDRFIAQARRYDVELVSGARVESVQADETAAGDLSVRLATGQELAAHAVLAATGSTYKRLGIAGEDKLIGAGVHFCATCDGPFYKGADEVLVVGGGNSALEEGLFLAQFASRVRIAQPGPELTASPLLQDKVRADPRFDIRTGIRLDEFKGEGKVSEVLATDTQTGERLSAGVSWSPTTRTAVPWTGSTPPGMSGPDRPSSSRRPPARASPHSCRSGPGCSRTGT